MAKTKSNQTVTTFVQTVREWRKKLDWNQEDLAHNSGVSITTIKNIERGHTVPNLETIVDLAKGFGCPTWQLFADGTSPAAPAIPTLKDAVFLLDSYQKAGPEERAIALSVLTHNLAHLDPFDDADLSAALSPLKAL